MSRYRDFDEAVAELEDIEFTVRGRRYSIPGDPPGGKILELLASGRISEASAAGEVLTSLLGKDNYEQMIEDGIGLTQLGMLTEWIMQQLGFSAAVGEAGGSGKASPSTTSLSNGARSKQTSGASTA